MDRIRQAVTRAREDQPAPAGAKTLSPRAGRAGQGGLDESLIRAAHCNFNQFGRYRIISNEQDPVLNAYRVLRTRVLQKMETEGWKTLAVVSPGAGAGKTVTAINLAIAVGSKQGSRSTLVDLDFYRPAVSRYLGLKDTVSVLDFFEGKKSLTDVTVRPDLPDTLLLANERVSRRGAEHLTSVQMDELINTTVHHFGSRIVIFDMSPLLGCDDTLAFLPKVDCVLLVAASGQTRVPELKEAQRILEDVNVVGTVLNKAPSSLVANPYY